MPHGPVCPGTISEGLSDTIQRVFKVSFATELHVLDCLCLGAISLEIFQSKLKTYLLLLPIDQPQPCIFRPDTACSPLPP